ncbi:MAG: hypothetical protein ACRBDL_11830 [Alphaproteobacteria bacterium]
MKRALFLTVCLCAFFPLIACQAEEPTEGQKKNIAEMERLDKLRAGGKCVDESIIVEIDGVRLKVPRYGTDITFEDGRKLKGLSEVPYMCDLRVAEKVTLIRSSTRGAISSSKNYLGWKKRILKEDVSSEGEAVAKGVRRIKKWTYWLESEETPTGNRDSVLIDCTNNPEQGLKENATKKPTAMCYAGYVHPIGLMISYRFFSHMDDFIDAELKKRQEIQRLIASKYEVKESQ